MPARNDVEMLELSAIVTPNTDAQTDVAPLIPQSHGVKDGRFDASFSPAEKPSP